MNNTLPHLIDLIFLNPIEIAVIIQGLHLNTRHLIRHTGNTSIALGFIRRDIVIRGSDIGIQTPGLAIRQTQTFKCLR